MYSNIKKYYDLIIVHFLDLKNERNLAIVCAVLGCAMMGFLAFLGPNMEPVVKAKPA